VGRSVAGYLLLEFVALKNEISLKEINFFVVENLPLPRPVG
jgi:hypothetical protein